MTSGPNDPSIFSSLAEALERQATSDWRTIARPSQLAPPGAWTIWLFKGGRGVGKTRSGAEWVREQVEHGRARRIALVGATAADVRDVMVEGESGILAISPAWNRPNYEPSKRRLTWPNGAIATTYSADEPDRLRGPQHDAAWCDELAAWRFPSAWDMLMFGLRLGSDPRCVVTTTPRPVKLVRDLIARAGKDVVITHGATRENAANLAPQFLAEIVRRYEGTRLGRQELEAELLDDVPGALWQRAQIDATRVVAAPVLNRVVVAIDPATTSGEESDETGIVVAGVGADRNAYIIEDLSGRYLPAEWARLAIAAYHRHSAACVVAETNSGGEMVGSTLRMLDPAVSFKAVRASRGKTVRAEPVAALYEQGRVHHVGTLAALEDQMCNFAIDADRSHGASPDRVDALVWALTDLVVDGAPSLILAADLDTDEVFNPRTVASVFAVVAMDDFGQCGIVHFATPRLDTLPLLIIDMDLAPLAPALFATVAARVDDLAEQIRDAAGALRPVHAGLYVPRAFLPRAHAAMELAFARHFDRPEMRNVFCVALEDDIASPILSDPVKVHFHAAVHATAARVKFSLDGVRRSRELPVMGALTGRLGERDGDNAVAMAAWLGIILAFGADSDLGRPGGGIGW